MGHILVVDDAKFMRVMLGNIIKSMGHTYEEAGDGLECLDLLKQKEFDLVTLDITMPNMDGLQTIHEIRQKYPAQKVVMVSAMGQQGMVVSAIQDGACDFIVKPFDADRVRQAIDKIFL